MKFKVGDLVRITKQIDTSLPKFTDFGSKIAMEYDTGTVSIEHYINTLGIILEYWNEHDMFKSSDLSLQQNLNNAYLIFSQNYEEYRILYEQELEKV